MPASRLELETREQQLLACHHGLRAHHATGILNSMITEKAFKRYTNQPKPFSIHLADGREIRVPHGEHIAIQPGGRMFLFWEPDGGFELFNLTMVTSIKAGGKGR